MDIRGSNSHPARALVLWLLAVLDILDYELSVSDVIVHLFAVCELAGRFYTMYAPFVGLCELN